MDHLTDDDMSWIRRRLPRVVFDLLKANPGNVFLAGGFIRACIANELVSDIDLFATDATTADAFSATLSNASKSHRKPIKTDNAWTVFGHGSVPIQIIHRWTFATPADCVRSFDFTVARAAVWFEFGQPAGKWMSVCDPRFYADLAGRKLVYTSPDRMEEAGGSLLRVLKFYQKGYRIPLDSFGRVIARCIAKIDWEQIHQCAPERQQAQIAKVITGLLREVDPNVDPEHLSHLPSHDEPDQIDYHGRPIV